MMYFLTNICILIVIVVPMAIIFHLVGRQAKLHRFDKIHIGDKYERIDDLDHPDVYAIDTVTVIDKYFGEHGRMFVKYMYGDGDTHIKEMDDFLWIFRLKTN